MKLLNYAVAAACVMSVLIYGSVWADMTKQAAPAAPRKVPPTQYQRWRYSEALVAAAEADNFKKVQWLIRAGASPNYCEGTYDKETALAKAAYNENQPMCQYLVTHGAKPDGYSYSTSPLCIATGNGDIEAMRILLELGANPQKWRDPTHMTIAESPLETALRVGDKEMLKLFFTKTSRFSFTQKRQYYYRANNSLLRRAIARGKLEDIQRLRALGAQIDNKYAAPVVDATVSGSLPVVDYLLEHGSNVDKSDYDKTTALMKAVNCGSLPILKTLLSHKARVDLQDERGRTALMYTGRSSVYFGRLVPESLGRGSSDDTPENLKRRLNGEATRLLLQHGAKVELRDNDGRTALMCAAQGNPEAVARLLAHRAKLNDRDKEGRTALHYAAAARDDRSLTLLLRHGALVNARDSLGATALMLAHVNPEPPASAKQRTHRLNCIRTLRRFGANRRLKDKDGDNAQAYNQMVDGYDIDGC